MLEPGGIRQVPDGRPAQAPPLDAHDALGVVQHMYRCALDGDERLWDSALRDLATLHDVERASALSIDQRTGGYRILSAVGFDLVELASSFRRYGLDGDPLFHVVRRLPRYATFRDGQVEDAVPVYGSPFNRGLAHPDNFAKHLVGVLRNDDENLTAVAFWRSATCPSFSDEQCKTLAWLLPHLDQVMQMRQRLDAAPPAAGRMLPPDTLLYEGARHGLVVLDGDGRVLLATREASRILATEEALRIDQSGLVGRTPRINERFREACAAAARGDASRPAPQVLRIPRPAGRLAYEVLVVPADFYGQSTLLPPGAATLVVMTDPGVLFRTSTKRLLALGLTAAEARVCESLMRTGALGAAAEDAGISLSTARSHVKNIYRKLGVSTQVELVQSLASGFDYGF